MRTLILLYRNLPLVTLAGLFLALIASPTIA